MKERKDEKEKNRERERKRGEHVRASLVRSPMLV